MVTVDTTSIPTLVDNDDLVPSQSSKLDQVEVVVVDEDRKLPAVVTPIGKSLGGDDDNNNDATRNNIIEQTESTESGDTESETSVASTGEVSDILLGTRSKTTEEKKPDPEGQPRPDPEGVTTEEKDTPVTKAEKEEEVSTKTTACVTPTAAANGLPSPPRKINRVSITAANFSRPSTPVVVSPTQPYRRVSTNGNNGTGLSELSKQLRVLQAKNQYIQSEMDRCQRQLKIMSESKGVSVVDVLRSMESACAREAHAELQSQVEGLQAQLEALKAGKSPARAGGASGSVDAAAISKATQLQHDSLKQQIAALQLQVGNHEELEAKYKEETKSLYAKVETHQAAALTLESTVEQKTILLQKEQSRTTDLEGEVKGLTTERDALKEKQTRSVALLQTEQARTSALEVEVKALTEERDLLKERQAKRMADFWQHTLQNRWSRDDQGEDWDGEVQKYMGFGTKGKDTAEAIPAPTNYPPTPSEKEENSARPGLQRTFSDPALWSEDQDAKASISKSYVASIIPRYSSTYKQWTYDVKDDTHRSQLYVKQSAKNMELEALCRHQQQTMQEMQEDYSKDKAKLRQYEQQESARNMELEILCRHQKQTIEDLQEDYDKDKARLLQLEQERNVAESRKNIFEQQVSCLQLDLRLETEQAESLRGQLKRREDEYLLKRDQMKSRLQVSKERSVDLEGQLSSLYVAFELLQEDRSEEQTEQAELKMRLVDADTAMAQQISKPTPEEDAAMAQELSDKLASATTEQDDVSEVSMKSGETAALRKRAGLLTPSPRRNSNFRSSFFRNSSSASLRGLPPPPPSGRRASTSDIGRLPPTAPPQSKRRSSTGCGAPPPPGTTICKGFLMQAHSKKKKLKFQKELGITWKRKYMVLKRDDMDVGTYCFWWGDQPKERVIGTIPHLIRGISTVSFTGSVTSDPDGKPHSFCIRINPNDPRAPEVHLAAYSAVDMEPWRQALQEALEIDVDEWSEYEQRRAEHQMNLAMDRNYAL